jgi:ferredoxin-thioredoxin reductase catalytic subunit
MTDQLNAIKRRHKSLTKKQGTDLCRDFEWLIAEVEKLRAQKREGLDIIAEQAAIIRNLNAELADLRKSR